MNITDKKILVAKIQEATGLSAETISSSLSTGYWSKKNKVIVDKIIYKFNQEKSIYLEKLKNIN